MKFSTTLLTLSCMGLSSSLNLPFAGKTTLKTLTTGETAVTTASNIANLINKYTDVDPKPAIKRNVNLLSRDMAALDDEIALEPQLSTLELTILSATVLTAGISPLIFPLKVVEVLAPACAALSASIGVSAEYIGRVAVADGKEIAAVTMQAAAEAESLLSQSERVKAVLPLCVGIGATAASFAILAPIFVEDVIINNLQSLTLVYLFSPLIAILSASIAGLATADSRGLALRAVNLGNRRFATKAQVGNSWLSQPELIEQSSRRLNGKWQTFLFSTLPGPIIGSLIPGSLATRGVIIAAIAAAQSAFYLSQAEYTLSRATDAVALKARSAAVSDTYANQGARSGAILPFTSALGGLCAAATAAVVEIIPQVGANLPHGIQAIGVVVFPFLSSLFAAAASVSKARCEVDALAAGQAAGQLSLEYTDEEYGGEVLQPFRGVRELIKLTTTSLGRKGREKVKRFKKRWRKKRGKE